MSFSDKLLSMTIVCSLFGLWDKDIDARSDFILSKGFSDLPPEFKELEQLTASLTLKESKLGEKSNNKPKKKA
ncbi:hypothetical protein [Pseudoalteromonas phenolica]|uniref:hypothetical protein n=1 Tax=Pseudoalteromonas phenolica TaxID=161398 RepID=UPI00110B6644|nr:hypothetical protein [Pseudoalteromonas phenolica]TMO57664.1 hypothetical protein CWC21_02175 [Pseudoalteromonas phenolica]